MKKSKFRQLHIVKQIYTHGSLSKAAEEVGITTAAVSKSCLDFEAENNILLFHRSKDGMIPTPICEEVVKAINAIQDEVKILADKIDAFKRDKMNPVRIGFQGGPSQFALFEILAALPPPESKKIGLYCMDRPALFNDLRSGSLDMIAVATTAKQIAMGEEFELIPITTYKCFVVDVDTCFSVEYAVAHWDIFRDKTWALPARGAAIRDQFEALLKKNDLEQPGCIIEYNTRFILMSIAKIRDVCAIIPDYAINDLQKFREVRGLDSITPDMSIDVGVLVRKERTNIPFINDMVDFFRNSYRS